MHVSVPTRGHNLFTLCSTVIIVVHLAAFVRHGSYSVYSSVLIYIVSDVVAYHS